MLRCRVIVHRYERGSLDYSNFLVRKKNRRAHVHDVGLNREHFLLTYDAYRLLSLPVLRYFKKHTVIIHALPANSSGKLHSFDSVCFSALKSALCMTSSQFLIFGEDKSFDLFDLFWIFLSHLRWTLPNAV